MFVGEESVMTRWEAEYKTIQALPAKDRAKVASRKIFADAAVKIVFRMGIGGGSLTVLAKWLF